LKLKKEYFEEDEFLRKVQNKPTQNTKCENVARSKHVCKIHG